ncbi:MAG TPA: FapA family protein, partial [Desulfosporosinus sp.]|nr:FapA family protein [Desulfosporosinus sp.]
MALKDKETVPEESEHQSTRLYRGIKGIPETKELILDSVFDGSIEIKNGDVLFTPPQGFGSFPLIMAGENVEIYLNGNKIETSSVVYDHDTVEVNTLDTEPSVNLEISLSKDKQKAFLTVKRNFGKKYTLVDCKPMQKAKVIARCVREEDPVPIRYEDVMLALQNKGVVFGIQEDAIMKAVQDTAKEFTVEVATSLPPVESVDASIMYNFQDENRSLTAKNPYGDGKIHSVSVGEIVAIKRPPLSGKPGIDVTGKPILTRTPKDVPILIKDGVNLINEGMVAIATKNGKPVLEGYGKKYLSVRPVHIVEGDVNLKVGNIKFNGDVIVTGSVYDGFSIEAGGSIRILGDVLHASLYANGDIVVNEKAISSRLQAGGLAVPYKRIFQMLTHLLNRLENLLAAMELVKAQSAFTTGDLKEK